MKKREFQKLLADGYGGALIYLGNCSDPMAYSKQILYCCTHNTCFDMQCEGDRAVYLHDAIGSTGNTEYFKDKIIARLQKGKFSDSWETLQMFALLVCFYNDGYTDVLDFMAELWEEIFGRLASGKIYGKKHVSGSFENLCITISQTDPSYYLKTINRVGEFLVKEPQSDIFSLDWFYSCFKYEYGKRNSEKLLKKIPSEFAEAFRNKFDHDFDRAFRKTVTPLTFDEVTELIKNTAPRAPWKTEHHIRLFGKKADREELIKLAEAAVSEENEEIKRIMLAAFEKTEFPLDAKFIFEILKSNSDSSRARAFDVMCGMSDSRVKDYAKAELDKLTENSDPQAHETILSAFAAFLSKSDKDDGKYILQKLTEAEESGKFDDGDLHFIYKDIQTAYEQKPIPMAEEVLTRIYRGMKCTMCRLDTIKIMSKRRCLSNDILKEAVYDANTETREYAVKVMKKRGINNLPDNIQNHD